MATHTKATLKLEDGILFRAIRDTGRAMEEDDGTPQGKRVQPLSYYVLLTSVFWHNLCFTNLKNVPSVLPDAVPTLSRAGDSHPLVSIPRHAHPPTGGTGGGQDRAPWLWCSCKGSTPHATGDPADTSPLQQMWEQPVEIFLCEGAAGTRVPPHPAPTAPAARPSWALLRPGGTGTRWHGMDGGHNTEGQKAARREWRSEQQHPHHHMAPFLRKPVPQNDTGAHLPSPWLQEPPGCTKSHQGKWYEHQLQQQD